MDSLSEASANPGHPAPGDGGNGIPPEQVQNLLESGEITDCRLALEGSNDTFLVRVVGRGETSCRAIYKPRVGERPLWDFPLGTLYLREYASYLVSQAIGWDFIPLTTIREGPHGIGALQAFVQAQRGEDYYSLQPHHTDQLWRMAVFDLFTNNADRKAGHCLLDAQDVLWGIDHGLTFNVDPKLRTVIWDFCGQAIPQPLLDDIERLLHHLSGASDLADRLEELLDKTEVESLSQRLRQTLADPVFPFLQRRRNVPWPGF